MDTKKVAENLSIDKIYLQVDLNEGETILASDHYFFDIPKNLKLSEPHISTVIKKKGHNMMIELLSEELVKNVFIWVENASLRFSDNYFDLLPGDTIIISVPLKDFELTKNDLQILSLNKILHQNK